MSACSGIEFVEPANYGSKLIHLKALLRKGKNIVSTHSLFRRFDAEALAIVRDHGYTLILDEVVEVAEPLETSAQDVLLLGDKLAVDSKGIVHWDDPNYQGAFNWLKTMCDLGSVGRYGNALVWLFPVSSFAAFQDVYVLTYMFAAQMQKSYYDYYGISYHYLGVRGNDPGNFRFSGERPVAPMELLKIAICDVAALNAIGESRTALSVSWYKKHCHDGALTTIRNNCINYFRNIEHAKSGDIMWTTYKEYEGAVRAPGFSKGFIPFNIRACNDYRQRHVVGYLVNRYLNPYVKNFFVAQSIPIDEDKFALSEMVQFVWRSAIRDGQPISIYIPSSRMRGLFCDWIREVSAFG